MKVRTLLFSVLLVAAALPAQGRELNYTPIAGKPFKLAQGCPAGQHLVACGGSNPMCVPHSYVCCQRRGGNGYQWCERNCQCAN